MPLTLIPAYGRDYRSKAAVEADFKADKDFRVCDFHNPNDGRYVNRADLLANGRGAFGAVNIRYNKLQRVAVIRV